MNPSIISAVNETQNITCFENGSVIDLEAKCEEMPVYWGNIPF